ncbi:hypothetical protein MO867_13295 [Microbulbifer sp. OS29]|uniref:Uncharacterized protein n=1 Tax=Microbulbifer okhotskensis TaxID=2926617 RepID=A0A9X2J586_9GAMM|nr:hypothetical protein [Microbulbifer okhotskensis]MCO1335307.1 hypothetical protein [Microbulbifer okhotskensis]
MFLPPAFIYSMFFSISAQAERIVAGILEEIISENLDTGNIERRLSLKDEKTGNFYFFDIDHRENRKLVPGDRIRIQGKIGKDHKLEIQEIKVLEVRKQQ